MLTIKTLVKTSPIAWLWVFADENILKGSIIWEYNPNLDKKLTKTQFKKLSSKIQSYVYYAQDEWGYILCGDNAKFTNHSTNPNTQKLNETQTIATKDILINEEITEDYYYFDKLAEKKLKLSKTL
jgi:SET domain-containing protein